jgi:malic enzyme
MAIAANPDQARNLTSRGNLVAVITNGTAVLGLGNIGALARKPVMEGKACLFKKFADIDVFDIELDEADPGASVQNDSQFATADIVTRLPLLGRIATHLDQAGSASLISGLSCRTEFSNDW